MSGAALSCRRAHRLTTALAFSCAYSPAAKMAEERALHESKLAKMEAEMKMVFQQKVNEKEAKLKQSEEELYARHRDMKDALEKQRLDLEEKKRRLESGRPLTPDQKVSSSSRGCAKAGATTLTALIHSHKRRRRRCSCATERRSRLAWFRFGSRPHAIFTSNHSLYPRFSFTFTSISTRLSIAGHDRHHVSLHSLARPPILFLYRSICPALCNVLSSHTIPERAFCVTDCHCRSHTLWRPLYQTPASSTFRSSNAVSSRPSSFWQMLYTSSLSTSALKSVSTAPAAAVAPFSTIRHPSARYCWSDGDSSGACQVETPIARWRRNVPE